MCIHKFIRKHKLIIHEGLVKNISYSANTERLVYQDYNLDIYLQTENLVLQKKGTTLIYIGYDAVEMWNNKIVTAIKKYNNLRLLANKL